MWVHAGGEEMTELYLQKGCRPSMLFDEKQRLRVIKGVVCMFCGNALRPGLTGMICEDPKCYVYLQPIDRWKNVYYRVEEYDKE